MCEKKNFEEIETEVTETEIETATTETVELDRSPMWFETAGEISGTIKALPISQDERASLISAIVNHVLVAEQDQFARGVAYGRSEATAEISE